MITPRYSSESRGRVPFDGRHAYFRPSFFWGEWRRGWPKMLCYTLLLFFVLPLPLLFEINSRRRWTAVTLTEALTRMPIVNLWLYCFAAVAIGVFAGVLATRYLCRRTSVDYYHSLPMRREGLLLQSWLCGVAHFLPALAVNLVLSLAVIASTSEMLVSALPVGKLFVAAGYMLIAFLLIYTLTVFCGMLCGTSSMQVIVTGLCLGAFPLFCALLLSFCSTVTSNIDLDYFWSQSWGWTSPVLRLSHLINGSTVTHSSGLSMRVLDEPMRWWEFLLWLAATVLLFAGAMLLYRRRRVERAGTPVVFDGVAVAVKWVVILLGTMATGLLFSDIGGTLFWLFFGFVLRGALSFMLINTILTRNPKQMFEGWKRMVIYLVAFCVCYIGLLWTVATIDGWIPKQVDRLALYFGGDNYSVPYYEDPEVIAAWQELWEKDPGEHPSQKMRDEYYETRGDSYAYASHRYLFNTEEVMIAAYARVGPFVIPYQRRSYIREDAEALLRAVTESAEFEAGWDRLIEESIAQAPPLYESADPEEEDDGYDEYTEISMYELFELAYGRERGIDTSNRKRSRCFNAVCAPTNEETFALLLADMGTDIGFEFFQSPAYAVAEARSIRRVRGTLMPDATYSNFFWHIHMNMPSLYREVMGMEEDAFYGAMADAVIAKHGGLYVAKHVSYTFTAVDDHVIFVKEREQVIEILRGLAMLNDSPSSYMLSDFTVLDEGYGVVFPAENNGSVSYFIKGKVPAFVRAALG